MGQIKTKMGGKTKRIIMYYKIKELLSKGFSKSKISRKLGVSRKTVSRYISMSEAEFHHWSEHVHKKPQKLERYENLVLGWLEEHGDLSGYQVHDWLLEHVPELRVSRRTVSTFVRDIRQKYHIPKPRAGQRYFEQSPELAYGKQAQVDFGEYKMTRADGGVQKVHFFGMVLSRSRYKFFYLQATPFTAADAVKAHEAAFEYFDGIPQQVVYDQDKVLLVSENAGDLVLTEAFRAYVAQRGLSTYFCRKADPQTKGKVENIIKYAKSNFLKNRTFTGVGLLNEQVRAWLERTGNATVHGSTHKVPAEEIIAERPHLAPFFALDASAAPLKAYAVRKDNTISYKGSFYSLPFGTFQGQGTKVWISHQDGTLTIYGPQRREIAVHKCSLEKGKLVSNTQHRRKTSAKIEELICEVASTFDHPDQARCYIEQLRELKPRYIRDQLQMMAKYCALHPGDLPGKALGFCMENRVFSARDFGEILTTLAAKEAENPAPLPDLLHKDIDRSMYNQLPNQSNIETYQTLINNH